MEETKELITTDDICSKVYIIRGQQVMLDKDLAELYGYEVKRLNEQVKRNISRFPEDFMFQLNKEEIPEKFSKSQIETLNEKSNRQGFNIKKMPFAFTEQGIYIQQAKKSIYVVDDYMNAKSLQHLSQKTDGVEVVLFTENGKGGRGFLTNSLVTDFQNEYPTIRIKPNPDCHDRLIVLDYGEETEKVYHCGASSKDAGKKLCAINQITETAIIHPVIDRLLSLPDKKI